MTTVAPLPAESLLLFETQFDHVACSPGYQELRSAGTEVAQVVLISTRLSSSWVLGLWAWHSS